MTWLHVPDCSEAYRWAETKFDFEDYSLPTGDLSLVCSWGRYTNFRRSLSPGNAFLERTGVPIFFTFFTAVVPEKSISNVHKTLAHRWSHRPQLIILWRPKLAHRWAKGSLGRRRYLGAALKVNLGFSSPVSPEMIFLICKRGGESERHRVREVKGEFRWNCSECKLGTLGGPSYTYKATFIFSYDVD